MSDVGVYTRSARRPAAHFSASLGFLSPQPSINTKLQATPSLLPFSVLTMDFQESNGVAAKPKSQSELVTYSCGSCGYDLNLQSSNRNTNNIGSKYGKQIKNGIVPFFSIDDSRFSSMDELSCVPCFTSGGGSWGILRRKSRLLCKKCRNFVGSAYGDGSSSGGKTYEIKISALQPSASPLL